jgi:hypothetical protein
MKPTRALALLLLLLGSHLDAVAAAPAAAGTPVFRHRTVSESIGHTRIADVDGDGKNDIVLHIHRDDWHLKDTARQTGLAYLRWPDFQEIRIHSGPISGERFAVADLNGNGRNDIVSAQLFDAKSSTRDGRTGVFWYENPGSGPKPSSDGSWREHFIGEHPGQQVKDVAVGDIDGDGRPDVVVRAERSTSLYFQKEGGWRFRELKHGPREGLALADLTRDGRLDIILNGFWFETPADPIEGEYVRHVIDGKWFAQPQKGMANAAYVAVGDLNGDGLPDVLFSHSETTGYPVSWYAVERLEQVRTGPWKERRIAEVFDWCETLEVADVDGDGHLDVLAAKFQRHSPPGSASANEPPFPVSIFYNVARDGSKWQRQDLGQDGIYAGTLGDVGSDGSIDVVGMRSYYKGPIDLWENQLRRRPAPSAR